MAVGYYDDDVMCDGMVTCYVWSREIKYFKYNNRPFQLILKTTLTINATSISLPPSLPHSPSLSLTIVTVPSHRERRTRDAAAAANIDP